MINFNNFFKDKDGKVILSQPPNPPILLWFGFSVVAHYINIEYIKNGFNELAAAALFLWAYLEITQGVNYFRRTLGAIVMLFIILSVFSI